MTFLNITENSTIMHYMGVLDVYVPNAYLQTIMLLIAVYIASKVFVWLLKHVVLALTHKTKTTIDDKLAEYTKTPLAWLLITIGARFAILPLELTGSWVAIISHLLNTASIILIAWIVIKVTDVLIDDLGGKWAKKSKSSLDDSLIPLFSKAANVMLMIVAVLFIFTEWSINITSVLAGLGIAGLALGFAVKDSLSNIFGGISILLDKALQVGDIIEVGGTSGEVVDVGLRSTRIRTWDNELLIIPNGQLANSEFKNWKKPNLNARIVIDFGVEYGAKHEKVKKIVLDVIKKHKKILKEPSPLVRFKEMGDSALLFGAYFWVGDIADKWSTKEDLVCEIYDTLNKHKIGIPFPQMDVHVKKK